MKMSNRPLGGFVVAGFSLRRHRRDACATDHFQSSSRAWAWGPPIKHEKVSGAGVPARQALPHRRESLCHRRNFS